MAVKKAKAKPMAKKKTAKDIFEFDDPSEDIFSDLDDPTTKDEVDDMVHVKVNFPPFQHFVLDESGEPVCVGKSH